MCELQRNSEGSGGGGRKLLPFSNAQQPLSFTTDPFFKATGIKLYLGLYALFLPRTRLLLLGGLMKVNLFILTAEYIKDPSSHPDQLISASLLPSGSDEFVSQAS